MRLARDIVYHIVLLASCRFTLQAKKHYSLTPYDGRASKESGNVQGREGDLFRSINRRIHTLLCVPHHL